MQMLLYTYKCSAHLILITMHNILVFFLFHQRQPKLLTYFSNFVISGFSGGLRLQGKSPKTFDIIVSAKSVYFKFRFGWGRSPVETPPLSLGAPQHAMHINTLCRQNTEFLTVTVGGTHSNQ